VRGFSFVYSGNFLVEAEVNEMGRLRINIGIHPMGLQWHLPPGAFGCAFCVRQRLPRRLCTLSLHRCDCSPQMFILQASPSTPPRRC
jgi:hypothetical protein